MFNRWIFTVAQTGKTRLDTHYSFPNKTIQAYVEDDKEILIEYDVLKDIIFNEGISSTTDILVDLVSLFVKISLKINKFKIRTGARETHELCWRKYLVEVIKSSNVSAPENIQQTKLQRYTKNDLFGILFP